MTSALVFVKLLNESPVPVREWNEAIPKDLERIILKLMAKERTQRFQTAHELFEALSRVGDKASGSWLRKAVGSVAPVPAQPSGPLVRERRSLRRRETEALTPEPPGPAAIAPTQDSRGQAQVLRPVARVPTGGSSSAAGIGSKSSASGGKTPAAEEAAAGFPGDPPRRLWLRRRQCPHTEQRGNRFQRNL